MNTELLNNHHLLSTDDIEEYHKAINSLWIGHDTRVKDEAEFHVHMNRVSLKTVIFTYIHCPADLILKSIENEEARYSFHLLLDDNIDYQIAPIEVTANYDSSVIHFSSEKMHTKTDSIRALLIEFDQTAVEQAFMNRFGTYKPPIPKAAEINYSTAPRLLLHSLCLWCAQQLNHQPENYYTNSKVWTNLEKALLNAFVDCIDRRKNERSKKLENPPQWFEAVEAWIDEHLDEPIMLQDLTHVARISERALQKSFRYYRNCTPMGAVYLRRLLKARAILQSPQPDTTVLQATLDVGYSHPSRFASHYKKQFGEKPSTTLSNARNKISKD